MTFCLNGQKHKIFKMPVLVINDDKDWEKIRSSLRHVH